MKSTSYVSNTEYPVKHPEERWITDEFSKRRELLDRLEQSYRTYNTNIHMDDEMWNGLLVGGDDPKEYVKIHYFYGGRSAMRNMIHGLLMSGAGIPKTILDFPSSHGRVTRFLRAAFPESEIWVGDINESGINYCENEFNCKKILSDRKLSKVRFPKKFDLIWCGSLATHLNEADCRALFHLTIDALEDNGLLGITTCGRGMAWAQKNMFETISPELFERIEKQLESRGFGYENYPGSDCYGMTFMDPLWVQELVFERKDCYILSMSEKGWHGSQDVYFIVKRDLSHWYDWGCD